MSFFNSNITGTGGSGGAAGGLVTKFEKSIVVGATETAEIQISLKDDVSNYADITNEQIIVDINNVGASGAGTANLTQSYDAEQGILTITSDNSKIPFVVNSTVKVVVYIAGAVQLPPVPPAPVYTLQKITKVQIANTSSNVATMTVNLSSLLPNYKEVNANNFVIIPKMDSQATVGAVFQQGDNRSANVILQPNNCTYNNATGDLTFNKPIVVNTNSTASGNNYPGYSQLPCTVLIFYKEENYKPFE